MTLKAILFDMDDTLLDWSQHTTPWEQSTRRNMRGVYHYVQDNLHPLDNEDEFMSSFWHFMGESWAKARQTLQAPHIGRVILSLLERYGIDQNIVNMDEVLAAYEWGAFPGVTVFADVMEVLPELRANGIRLGLVTNSAQPILVRERELKAFGLDILLDADCRLTAADVGYLKPHPEIFRYALERIGARSGEAVFVGDSYEADILGAQSVGMKAVLRRIPHRIDQLTYIDHRSAPDAYIDTLHDLYPILDEWFSDWRTR